MIGLVPVFGEWADGINGAWYLAQGDYVNSALSFASMIPVAGYAASTVKGVKYVDEAVEAASAVSAATKGADNAADAAKAADNVTPPAAPKEKPTPKPDEPANPKSPDGPSKPKSDSAPEASGTPKGGNSSRGKNKPDPEKPESVTPGGRKSGGKAVAGHGWYQSPDGKFTLPKGVYLHFYVQHREKLADSVGTSIERGARDVKPVETFGPGERVHDYIIGPPKELNIMSGSITVSEPRLLSEMIGDGTISGVCHMAVCREVIF